MNHRKHFAVLDGWRGLAAVAIVVLHCPAYGYIYDIPFVRHSGLFVDFFFVLSGFVIAYNYSQQISSYAEIWVFMRRRFARLWPLHVSVLSFLIALELIKYAGVDSANSSAAFVNANSIPAIFTNLTLTQGLGFHHGDTWNGPAESISLEFYTYLIFAAVCFFARRMIYGVALAVVILSAIAIIVVSSGDLLHLGRLDIVRCVYSFFAGALVYWFFVKSWPLSVNLATCLEVFAVVAAVAFVSLGPKGPYLLFTPVVFGLVVYVFAFESGLLSRVIGSAPIVAVGAMSYSIYMIHGTGYLLFVKAIKMFGGPSWFPHLQTIDGAEGKYLVLAMEPRFVLDIILLASVAAVIAASALTYRYIEMPGQRMLNPRRS